MLLPDSLLLSLALGIFVLQLIKTRNKLKDNKNQLEILFRKEKEFNELKSRFISLASHEIKTPLTGIASSANLIFKYLDRNQSSQIMKHIDSIKGSVDRMDELTNECL